MSDTDGSKPTPFTAAPFAGMGPTMRQRLAREDAEREAAARRETALKSPPIAAEYKGAGTVWGEHLASEERRRKHVAHLEAERLERERIPDPQEAAQRVVAAMKAASEAIADLDSAYRVAETAHGAVGDAEGTVARAAEHSAEATRHCDVERATEVEQVRAGAEVTVDVDGAAREVEGAARREGIARAVLAERRAEAAKADASVRQAEAQREKAAEAFVLATNEQLAAELLDRVRQALVGLDQLTDDRVRDRLQKAIAALVQ